MYYIDLQEEKILYDFKKINNNHCKVSLKFYNNAILWKHLITLLKNLEQDYHKIRNILYIPKALINFKLNKNKIILIFCHKL